jgi:hypothetical protein
MLAVTPLAVTTVSSLSGSVGDGIAALTEVIKPWGLAVVYDCGTFSIDHCDIVSREAPCFGCTDLLPVVSTKSM